VTTFSSSFHSACLVRYLGIEDYQSIWEEMKSFTLTRTPETPDELWVLQHKPVFTLGQAGKPEHILDSHGIDVVNSDRGGQVTYHGPGQLVIYLLIDVKRNKFGVRQLVDVIENSIISVLSSYSVTAVTKTGAPGVYVNDEKIAALGLRIKKGCSYHGLSFNIDMNLEPFTYINPCGYEGLKTTQLKCLLPESRASLFVDVQEKLVEELIAHLEYNSPDDSKGNIS
jgi:lipoyl(octanoyl) transferase